MSGTIWIASYPKSGNTWLRAVFHAWRLGRPVELNDLMVNIAAARHPFDDALGVLSSDLTPSEIALLRPRVDELLAAEATEPFTRKTHDSLEPGPAGKPVLSTAATRSALYVVRDPRDVAVSYAHHVGRDTDWAAAWLANPDAVMGPSAGALEPQLPQRLGTWSQHVRSWVEHAPFPVHVLRYEDCIAAPVDTFGRALAVIAGAAVKEQDVAKAVERASFTRLQGAEEAGGFREQPPNADARFFRSGRAGAWRSELSAAAAARIESEHGDLMRRFSYL